MRKYLVLLAGAFVLAACLLALFLKKPQPSLLAQKRNYSLAVHENETGYLSFPFLLASGKSYVTDPEQLIAATLTDANGSEIALELDSITKSDLQKIKYQKKRYQSYDFRFKVAFTSSETEWYMENAYLILQYSAKTLRIAVGSFSYVVIPHSEHDVFAFANIKPLVSVAKGNTYLAGLVFGLRSTANQTLTLNKISLLNCDLTVGREITLLDDLPLTNKFRELTGYDFDTSATSNPDCDIVFLPGATNYILLPLRYRRLTIIKSFPVVFEFTIASDHFKQYLTDYLYYDVTTENIKADDLYMYNLND